MEANFNDSWDNYFERTYLFNQHLINQDFLNESNVDLENEGYDTKSTGSFASFKKSKIRSKESKQIKILL